MTPRSSGWIVARGKAAAVDHDAVEILTAHVAVELDGAAGGDDAFVQLRQYPSWLDMALGGKEQALAETAFQRGLEFGEALGIQALVVCRAPRKAFEIAAVARMRHHQRAVERRVRQFPAPQIERLETEPADDRFGDLALAIGRQHAAGPVAGGEHHRLVAALMQRDRVAGLRKQQRLPRAGNACADDGNGGIPPR